MIVYTNAKAMVPPPDVDIEYFDILDGDLVGKTLVPYMLIIYLDYLPQRRHYPHICL